jgi:hypothetical protein
MSEFFIINDETHRDLLFPNDKYTGLDLSARPEGRAYAGTAEPFPDSWLIPRSDWQGIIAEQKERKMRIIDEADRRGIKVKNQQRTNYCWANAPTHLNELIRMKMNLPPVSLSPASVAATLKGFRNVGGWGKEAVEFMTTNGVAPTSLWPDNAIDRQYATTSTKSAMLNYRVTEWWELEPRNHDQAISLLLRGYPIAVGLNWWGHEITFTYVEWVDGEACPGIDNSWGTDWGTNGRGILQGKRALADDAVAPRDVMATAA